MTCARGDALQLASGVTLIEDGKEKVGDAQDRVALNGAWAL